MEKRRWAFFVFKIKLLLKHFQTEGHSKSFGDVNENNSSITCNTYPKCSVAKPKHSYPRQIWQLFSTLHSNSNCNKNKESQLGKQRIWLKIIVPPSYIWITTTQNNFEWQDANDSCFVPLVFPMLDVNWHTCFNIACKTCKPKCRHTCTSSDKKLLKTMFECKPVTCVHLLQKFLHLLWKRKNLSKPCFNINH